jgi:hypothetical protein
MPLTYRRTVGLLVALLLAVSSTHLRAATCKTTESPFTANLLPPPGCPSPIGICITGTLEGKSPETYSFVMDTYLDLDPDGTQAEYTGHSVITRTHGGATLIGQETGVLTFNFSEQTGTFVTTVNITGGTKQFANATGQYVATSEISFATGEGTGTFTSTICK